MVCVAFFPCLPHYELPPLTLFERLLLEAEGKEPEDPDAPVPLCPTCAKEYMTIWLALSCYYNSMHRYAT